MEHLISAGEYTHELQLMRYHFTQLQSIQLVRELLKGSFILTSLMSPKVITAGMSLVLALQSPGTSWYFWDYSEEDYSRLITPSALTLANGPPERKLSIE
jgi:hypothetical protein